MMTDLPELIILDVGHGNCAILRDTDGTTIIDCPAGSTLMKTLRHLKISEISSILISHADQDHIGGVTNLLSHPDIKVHNVFLNTDTLRRTENWGDLRSALRDARKRMGTKVHVGITTTQTGQLDTGQVEIEVLAPTPELAMSGASGRDLQGNQLSSNSMSVVVGLIHDSHRVAILPGDIDDVGFRNLLEDRDELQADILVFPHHGGRAGSADDESFAHLLCSLVKPRLILFSIDRNHLINPREGVIRGIRSAVPTAQIICTQLSRRCAAQLPDSDYAHLANLPAKGRASNSCCGGTISIKLNGKKTFDVPLFALHREFVGSKVSTPMCLRPLARTQVEP